MTPRTPYDIKPRQVINRAKFDVYTPDSEEFKLRTDKTVLYMFEDKFCKS